MLSHLVHEVVGQLLEHPDVPLLVVDHFHLVLTLQTVEALPVYLFSLLNYIHDIFDAYALIPDHNGHLPGHLILFLIDPKCLILEHLPVLLIAEQYI